ncbi:MAG TPA: hypothetical protein ENK31_09955, partial [Nannocystis exedens]|nr:hypothetical protein [Nannocystis exedens]
MSRQLRRLFPVLLLPLALSQLSACNCNNKGGGLVASAIDARMPGPEFKEFSSPAGFIDGGTGYVAFRPNVLQRWLQSVPLPADAADDLAEAGRELGIDLRTGDVVSHFGLDPEGVISMTLGRPLLGDGEVLFDEAMNLPPPKPDAFPAAGNGPSNVPPSLASRLGAVGFHFRIHAPVTSSEAFVRELKRLPPDSKLNAPICADFQPNVFCAADREAFVLVRELDKALVADIFVYPGRLGEITDKERRGPIDAALKMEKGAAPVTLRGDAAGYVDSTRLRDVALAVSLTEVASSLRWSVGDQDQIQREREKLKAIDALRGTKLLLRGARWELAVSDEAIRSTFSWEPLDDAAAKTLDKLLAHRGLKADAPSIDGLCTNSLVCARTSGLPSLDALRELATGVYGAPLNEFGKVMDQADELGVLVIALETWPNILGAAGVWPTQEAKGPEAAILSQVMSGLSNFAGVGGSLRSLQMPRGRGAPAIDFVSYMRVSGAELGAIRGFSALAGQRFNPLELKGVSGKIESMVIPEEDLQASVYLVTDEKTVRVDDRDVEVGWIAAADGADRITWLLGLDRETEIEPAVYFEIPDLTRLLATMPEA